MLHSAFAVPLHVDTAPFCVSNDDGFKDARQWCGHTHPWRLHPRPKRPSPGAYAECMLSACQSRNQHTILCMPMGCHGVLDREHLKPWHSWQP